MSVVQEFNEFSSALSVATSLRAKANSASTGMLETERHLLYEAIFLRLFRAYENLLENVFLSYLLGAATGKGVTVGAHVIPIDRVHARALITSSQPFLDWTSPQTVIRRAETYMVTGEPIRGAIAASQSSLQQAKKIRNHIAHNSTESAKDFGSVVINFLHTAPLSSVGAGEFLTMIPSAGPSKNKEILSYFLDSLEKTARALVD